jgi:hypothetical protein
MTFQLIIPTSQLIHWPSGGIAGQIWLESEDRCFPERGWSDLPVAVIRVFVHFTRGLITAQVGQRRTVHFREGPFAVTLTRLDDDRLQCSTNGAGRVPDWTAVRPFAEWQASLWSEAEGLLDACTVNGWDSPDLEALTSMLSVG